MANSEFKFCPRCAAALTQGHRFGALRNVCPQCGWIHFHDPKVAAAVLVVQAGHVLLVRARQRTVSRAMDYARGLCQRGRRPG